MCNAIRYHIKSVIENQTTTNKDVYDSIIDYFAQKLKNLSEQKELISETL
jgi:4-hydroxy-3-methylbut-2-enyl diphosphate reductase IspH